MTRRQPHATVVVLCRGADLASWPLAGIERPDLSAVDALARLQLAARRLGCSIQLRDTSAELSALLDLVGMSRCLEVGGEPGDQPGVEEVVMPDDPVA